jgi:glucose/arabinose dehydrogenase
MRNDYDVAFRPGTDEAWLTMNGPDAQDPYGQDLLLAADTTAPTPTDFGFPGCVYALPPVTPVVAQNRNPAVADVCDGTQTLPKALMGLHTSADGLAFGPPGGPWAGNLFVAQFGNFSGSQVVGHRVLRLAVDGAGNVGRVQELMIGGLPLDLAFGPDGLYIADFALGVLFIPNVLASLLPTCADQQSGVSETGIVSGPVHTTVEPLTGPLQPTIHTVNCMLLARLGL